MVTESRSTNSAAARTVRRTVLSITPCKRKRTYSRWRSCFTLFRFWYLEWFSKAASQLLEQTGICLGGVCGWSWQQWSCDLQNRSTHQPLLSDVRFSYVRSWRCASSQTNTSSRLTDFNSRISHPTQKELPNLPKTNVISLACSSSFVLSAARLSYSWQNG